MKDLKGVAAFYAQALGMSCTLSDEHHFVLNCRGFNLIVHQIPKHIADGIVLQQPPHRRVEGALRLNFPVQSIAETRRLARSLGGQVDDTPLEWAEPDANVFLGYDQKVMSSRSASMPANNAINTDGKHARASGAHMFAAGYGER